MKMCTDCGGEPQWVEVNLLVALVCVDSGYCKRCHRKAGYKTSVEIDLDALSQVVQEKTAKLLIGLTRQNL